MMQASGMEYSFRRDTNDLGGRSNLAAIKLKALYDIHKSLLDGHLDIARDGSGLEGEMFPDEDFLLEMHNYQNYVNNSESYILKKYEENFWEYTIEARFDKIEKVADDMNSLFVRDKPAFLSKFPEEMNKALLELHQMREDIRELMRSCPQVASSEVGFENYALSITNPTWIKDPLGAGFVGKRYGGDYKAMAPDKTLHGVLIKQTGDWPDLELKTDGLIVICALNCPVVPEHIDEGCYDISPKTLKRADEQDLEVIDSAHELGGRGYKGHSLTTMVQVGHEGSGIINDYNLSERIHGYCEENFSDESDKPRSITIFIVADSKNIKNPNSSLKSIIKEIDFGRLSGDYGINDIDLEILSCNTLHIMEQVKDILMPIVTENHLRIKGNFYGGYVFNNISYGYIQKHEHDKMREELDGHREIELSEEDRALFYSDSGIYKISSMVQILTPGFCCVKASDEGKLKEFVVSKKFPVSFGDGESLKVLRKLVKQGELPPRGICFGMEIDSRESKIPRRGEIEMVRDWLNNNQRAFEDEDEEAEFKKFFPEIVGLESSMAVGAGEAVAGGGSGAAAPSIVATLRGDDRGQEVREKAVGHSA